MNRKEAVLAMLDGKKVRPYEGATSYMSFDKMIGFRYNGGTEEEIRSALYRDYGYVLVEEQDDSGFEEAFTVNGEKLYRKVTK